MKRIKLGTTLEFSQIVYGMWRIGDDSNTAPAHVQAKIESCLAQGITTFDQADIYGGYTAEQIFGDALKAAPQLRDQMEIVSKCGIVAPVGRHSSATVKHYNTSTAHINASVDQSLSDLGTDHLDLLLIHRPDPFMDHEETGRALDSLIASGKIKGAGVSNFRPWDFSLLQSAMSNKLVTNQIELSLTEPAPFTNGDLAFLQERNLKPMAWSPLGGGSLFSNKEAPLYQTLEALANELESDAATVAIAWLLAHPAGIIPVLGTNNLSRIAAIGQAASVKLTREQWFTLYSAAIGKEVA
jgi:predicted oxidoreductase